MCGRYGRVSRTERFASLIGLEGDSPHINASRNLPPGLFNLAAATDPHEPSAIAMQTLYWGFIPSWAQKPALAQINARVETAHEKPFFRKAFAKRRCLIAADWWYEWQRGPSGKQPYVIRPAGGEPFFFAGIWAFARNLPADHRAAGCRTFAILTTAADPSIGHIHHRMPIALTEKGARSWLETGTEPEDLHRRLERGRHGTYESWPVSSAVNKPDNDDPALLEPIPL